MTDRAYLKNEVLVNLGEKVNSFGFKLLKSACEFTKKTDFGWNKYQIVFILRDVGWELKPSLLIRFDVVENIFHQISDFDRKHQKGTPTIGISIEDLDNSLTTQKRFELSNETHINSVVQSLFDVFKNSALPFFSKYDSLSEIDNRLNSCIDDTSLTGGIFKGTKSLIIAKLTKRQDFEKLLGVYQSYYENFSDGFYLPEYLRLKELLSSSA